MIATTLDWGFVLKRSPDARVSELFVVTRPEVVPRVMKFRRNGFSFHDRAVADQLVDRFHANHKMGCGRHPADMIDRKALPIQFVPLTKLEKCPCRLCASENSLRNTARRANGKATGLPRLALD